MKNKTILLTLIMFFMVFPIVFSDIPDQQNVGGTTASLYIRYNATFNYAWYNITTNSSFPLKNISANFQRIGLPSGNMWIEIYNATSNVVVNTSRLAKSNYVSITGITNSTYYNFTFNTTYQVYSGQKYAIIIATDLPVSTTAYIKPLEKAIIGTYYSVYGQGLGVWKVDSSNTQMNYQLWSQNVTASSNFTITAKDFYTSTTIDNFSATVNGTTYNTTNGTIITSILNSVPTLYDINITSNDSGGYFNRTYNSYNLSVNLVAYIYQSNITFTASQYINNATLTNMNFSTTYLTNVTHYMKAGTYTVNTVKTGYFQKSAQYTPVALSTATINIENVTDTRLNLTIKNILNGTTILSWSTQINISAYNFTKTISTTNGSSLEDAISGTWTALISAAGYATTAATFNLTTGTNNLTVYLYTAQSVNVTFRDELTNLVITPTNVSIDLISSAASYNYSTTTGYLYFDLVSPSNYTLRYVGAGYNERFNYLEISDASNQNITLYLLPVAPATNITLTVVNENAQNVEGSLVRILKYDLATNSYIEREVQFTNYAGQIVFEAELGTEFYKFFVEYPVGETVLITNPAYILSTSLTLQINTGSIGSNLDDYLNIDSEFTFNNVTNNFRVDFSNSQNLLGQVCIYVFRTDLNRTPYNTTCSVDGLQTSSILSGVEAISGRTYRADLYYILHGYPYYVASKTASFDYGTDWGVWGLLIDALLTIILIFMFKESLVNIIIVAPLPTVAASLSGIILIPIAVSLSIMLLSWVLAYFVSRYST